MRTSRTALILGFALAAITSVAQAQLIYREGNVRGNFGTGVVARFQVWIDAGANTVVIDIDNTVPAPSNPSVGTVFGKGTIISFGFNLPAMLGVNDTGDVAMRAKLTSSTSRTKWYNPSGSSRDIDVGEWTSTLWEEHEPYDIPHQPAIYDQDYGASVAGNGIAGSTSYGIRYGEKATFEFTFNNDFNASAFAGFFDRTSDLTAYWENVDSEVWTKKKTKWSTTYSWVDDSDCQTWDKGYVDFTLPSDGDIPATPEPSTYGLLGAAALLGLVAHRRHRAKKAQAS